MSDKTSASKSGGISQGDNASGNINITGGVRGDFVAGDKIVFEAPTPVVTTLHQLPPPSPDFTGRERELTELRERFTAGATISGVQGMGGIGKTALALKLADELQTTYPDAQFYLDLKGVSEEPLSALDAMRHVIYAYYPTAQLPDELNQLAATFRSVLHGQRALLLMDNARDAEQVAPLIPPANCALLVTSRSHFTIPGLHSIDLSSLRPEEAKALLVNIAPRIGNDAGQLAEVCGHLPLALELAANALKVKVNISPGDYCRRLKEARLKVLDKVEASLKVSYDLLGVEQQRLWSILSVFPGDFDEGAAASIWEEEMGTAQDELGELLVFSLLEWNETTARYRMHDLAREYAAANLNETEREVGRRAHAAHYRSVLANADDIYLEGGEEMKRGLALYDEERVNIKAGWKWAQTRFKTNEEAARLCISYPNDGMYVLHLRQRPRDRIEGQETMLAAARALKRRDAEAWALGNLGQAYAALGKTRKAIEHYEQSLEIAREIGDRRGEGNALGDLGNAYAALGEMRKAIESHEQSLEIVREIGYRRGEGATLGNLGIAYAALGETRKAIEYYEQNLEIAREIGDRRGEGNALGDLGVAYSALGEAQKAIERHKQNLEIAREIGDRGGESRALGNLGNAYAATGETQNAIVYYEQVLEIARELEDRLGEGQTLGNLGIAYWASGETQKAIKYYEQHLEIAREIGDRRGEGKTLGNLGNAYAALGETQNAIEYYGQCLEIAREIGDRRGEAYSLHDKANALDTLGDRAQAIELLESALKIYGQIESPSADEARKLLSEWREK